MLYFLIIKLIEVSRAYYVPLLFNLDFFAALEQNFNYFDVIFYTHIVHQFLITNKNLVRIKRRCKLSSNRFILDAINVKKTFAL